MCASACSSVRRLLPPYLLGSDKKTCTKLLDKVKAAYWRGKVIPSDRALVQKGSAFCKKFSRNHTSSSLVNLDRYVQALALRVFPESRASYHFHRAPPKAEFGLSLRLAERNPDLVEFNRQEAIRWPRGFFGHQKIPVREGQALIHFEGALVPWDVAKKKMFGNRMPSSLSLPHGWKYIDKGIVEQNLVKWTTLEPCWKLKRPAKKGEFFIDLVTKKRHSWLRLIDDEGNVISVGFVSKPFAFLPFRSQKGKLTSPDRWEFNEGTERCVQIPVTKEQYEKVKARIERDQKEENLLFNSVTRNCSAWVTEVLGDIGIKINSREYPTEMFSRWLFSLCGFKVPKCLEKVCAFLGYIIRCLMAPIFNLIILSQGGTYCDRDIRAMRKEKGEKWASQFQRPFPHFWSFLAPSNTLFSTGWKIREWQESQPNCKTRVVPRTEWSAI